MFGGHVMISRLLPGEMPIAFLAVMMIWTLYVVLLSHVGALEVDVAVIAGPV
jgi:hypothetical protein